MKYDDGMISHARPLSADPLTPRSKILPSLSYLRFLRVDSLSKKVSQRGCAGFGGERVLAWRRERESCLSLSLCLQTEAGLRERTRRERAERSKRESQPSPFPLTLPSKRDTKRRESKSENHAVDNITDTNNRPKRKRTCGARGCSHRRGSTGC